MNCPIHWDDKHNEPYMILPKFPELRLTPFRKGDDEQLMKLYNDPLIGSFAKRRPYPYLPEHMSFIWEFMYPGQLKIAAELKSLLTRNPADHPIPSPELTTWPFAIIRTKSGDIAGDITTWYSSSTTLPQSIQTHQEKEVLEASGTTEQENSMSDVEKVASVFAGHAAEGICKKDQIFEIAYNVGPDWRRKGLGAEMVGLVQVWAKWMGLGRLAAHVEVGNLGSQAVVRKMGFGDIGKETVEWPVDKGGGYRELIKFEYTV